MPKMYAVSSGVLNLIYNTYDPFSSFLHQKPLFQNKKLLLQTFFTQFVLCLNPITVLLEILGGRMHGPSHPPQIWVDRPLPPP